jgi:hypothetical protein
VVEAKPPHVYALRDCTLLRKLLGLMAKSLSIAELIEQVKTDLLREHESTPALFAISEVEVQVSFTAERNASGGIDLQVVQLGAGGATSQTHSVTIRLEPLVTPDDVRAELDESERADVKRVVTRGDESGSTDERVTRRRYNDLAAPGG